MVIVHLLAISTHHHTISVWTPSTTSFENLIPSQPILRDKEGLLHHVTGTCSGCYIIIYSVVAYLL